MNAVHDQGWMKLQQDENGEAFVSMKNDAVMIIAVTDKREILFLEENSVAYHIPTLNLPTGAVEKNELPEITADRELQIEVGYHAEKLTYIGTLHPSIKYMQWQCHIYVAQNLMRAELNGSKPSRVTVRRIPLAEFEKFVLTKKVSDATTIAAIYLARQYLST